MAFEPLIATPAKKRRDRNGSLLPFSWREVWSFPFCFLRKAFFTARLSGRPHELVATLADLSDQSLAVRSDDFFDWSQIGKERAVGGHGKPETNSAAERFARCEVR